MFGIIPYKQYASFFNVWGIFVASAQSGADHPLENIYKDIYFNASFGTSTPRLVTFSNSMAATELLAEHIPDYDIVYLLVNDSVYGGSGGEFAVVTLNNQAYTMVLHETGHSFAALADEYESAYSISPVEMLNITAVTRRDRIKWNQWILPHTPVPTPETGDYSNVVGLFEGAMYQPAGWYRPKLQCTMRTLDTTFCEVCIEAHVYRIYLNVSPIKDVSPQETSVVYNGNPLTFSVETHSPVLNTSKIVWMLNDQIVSQETKMFIFDKLPINEENFLIKAIVQDTTTLVRQEVMLSLLSDTIQWNVSVKNTGTQLKYGLNDISFFTDKSNKEYITLKMHQPYSGVLNIKVFSILGKRIYNENVCATGHMGNFSFNIPVNGLRAGTYIIKISNPVEAGEKSIRFIKMY